MDTSSNPTNRNTSTIGTNHQAFRCQIRVPSCETVEERELEGREEDCDEVSIVSTIYQLRSESTSVFALLYRKGIDANARSSCIHRRPDSGLGQYRKAPVPYCNSRKKVYAATLFRTNASLLA